MGRNQKPTHRRRSVGEFVSGSCVFGPHLKPLRICVEAAASLEEGTDPILSRDQIHSSLTEK